MAHPETTFNSELTLEEDDIPTGPLEEHIPTGPLQKDVPTLPGLDAFSTIVSAWAGVPGTRYCARYVFEE